MSPEQLHPKNWEDIIKKRKFREMKEKDVVKELRRISTDEESIPAVKDEAHAGILKLS